MIIINLVPKPAGTYLGVHWVCCYVFENHTLIFPSEDIRYTDKFVIWPKMKFWLCACRYVG